MSRTGYDPNQPRDKIGRWSEAGNAAREASGSVTSETVYIKEIDAIVDKEISELVLSINRMGLRTMECCSGHVEEDFLSTHVYLDGFNKEALKKLKKVISATELNFDWEFVSPWNPRHTSLQIKGGLFSENSHLLSTEENVKKAYADIMKLNKELK
jgi:hypothetical protein